MINEQRENGCKVFCIYFNNKEDKYNFGKCKGKSNQILEEIARLGGTEQCYNSSSLIELYQVFDKINEAIETNYKLKLKNK